MNLHGIVSGAIGQINPNVQATVKRSNGYATNPDGSRVPAYTTFIVSVQAQSLQFTDITQLDALNIQGVRRAIYLSGEIEATVRVAREGGDVLVFPVGTFPEGTTWLAAVVLEAWPDWRKVAITLQNGS